MVRMDLTNGSRRARNPSRGGPIPVDWLGSGVPGNKWSQGKGQVQPGHRAAGFLGVMFLSNRIRYGKAHKKKTPSNGETRAAEIQGQPFFWIPILLVRNCGIEKTPAAKGFWAHEF